MKKTLISLCCLLMACAVKAGKVDTVVIHSDVMNRDIPVIIVSPTLPVQVQKTVKGKKQPAMPRIEMRFPVVYLLHGAYGSEKAWLEIKPNLPEIADEKGMIFVTAAALNSWYFDSPILKDFQYETFMTQDLIDYVDTHYSTFHNRHGRAITGLSMGGHGAFFLSMRHKDLYGAAGSMSGGLDIRPFPLNWNIPDVLGEMASHKQSWDEHSVVNQIDRINDGDLWLTFDCGEDDFFLEVNKDLHRRLLGRGIRHDFATRPGGHTSEYWANSLDYHLLFFEKYFQSAGTYVGGIKH
ncbi:MAG: esterase family protein [Prevotella sp.]|nr:esterase family protein [Prevotella sp.]